MHRQNTNTTHIGSTDKNQWQGKGKVLGGQEDISWCRTHRFVCVWVATISKLQAQKLVLDWYTTGSWIKDNDFGPQTRTQAKSPMLLGRPRYNPIQAFVVASPVAWTGHLLLRF